jgi:virulence-associated protein VagC
MGRNQAVRIPVEFELPGSEAIMHREGDRLVMEPARKRGVVATIRCRRRRSAVTLWVPDQEAPSGDSYFKMAERAVAAFATMP